MEKAVLIILFLILQYTLTITTIYAQNLSIEKKIEYSITIDQAYSIAITNSADMALQEMSLAIKRKAHKLGIRAFLPQASISGANTSTINQFASDSYQKNVTLNVTQPLFQGGKILYNRKLTKTKLLIEQEKSSQTYYTLIQNVWLNFYSILQTNQELEIRKKTVDLLQDQVQIVELQKQQGSITEIQYLETLTKIKSEEIALEKLKFQLYTQKITFANQINIPSPDIRPFYLVPFVIDYSRIDIPSTQLPKLKALAKDNNFDLKEKNIQIEEIRANLTFNRLQFVPSIDLQLSGSLSGDAFPLDEYNYSIGVALKFENWGSPLNTGGNYSSTSSTSYTTGQNASITPFQDLTQLTSMSSIKLQESQLLAEIDKIITSLEQSIPQVVAGILFQQNEYSLQKDLLELETKKKKIYLAQSEQGKVTPIKLLEYLLEYQKKQLALIQVEFALQKSLKELEFTLGIYEGSLIDIL